MVISLKAQLQCTTDLFCITDVLLRTSQSKGIKQGWHVVNYGALPPD